MENNAVAKMEKTPIIINALFAILMLIATIVCIACSISNYITKSIASGLFVFAGGFNLFYAVREKARGRKLAFIVLMLIGLGLAFCGDILLIDNLILGAAFFAVGQIMFIAAFVTLSGFRVRDAVIAIFIFIAVYLLINFYDGFGFGRLKTLVVILNIIISLMLGKALSNVISQNNRLVYALIAIGAGLLFVSDIMQIVYLFAGRAFMFKCLYLSTYYPSEFVLALSIFFTAKYFIVQPKMLSSKANTQNKNEDLESNNNNNNN